MHWVLILVFLLLVSLWLSWGIGKEWQNGCLPMLVVIVVITGTIPQNLSPREKGEKMDTTNLEFYDAHANDIGMNNTIKSVAFSPDSYTLAVAANTEVKLWNTKDLNYLRCTGTLSGHDAAIRSIKYSPDGTYLAAAAGTEVKLWSVQTKEGTTELAGYTDPVTSIAFSPDGTLLASGSEDKTIKLWNVQERREVTVYKGHEDRINTVAFSPNGAILASGSDDGTIRLWSISNISEAPITLISHQTRAAVTGVTFTGVKEGILCATMKDGHIIIWSPDFIRLGGIKWEDWCAQQGHYPSATSIDKMSVSGLLATAGGPDQLVKLWEIKNKMRNGFWAGVTLGMVKLDRLRLKLHACLTEHIDAVSCTAFSPDKTLLATGSEDGIVKLWVLREILLSKSTQSYATLSADGEVLKKR